MDAQLGRRLGFATGVMGGGILRPWDIVSVALVQSRQQSLVRASVHLVPIPLLDEMRFDVFK